MIKAGMLDWEDMARKKTIMSKPWNDGKDIRKSGKACSQCGAATFMGTYENVPPQTRERWTKTQYIRFCGPECEEKGGW